MNDEAGPEFASAGTIAGTGNRASDAAIAVATHLGIDLTDHRAAHLTTEVITDADLIYGMEAEHVSAVLELDPGARVELLAPGGEVIPDPYGLERSDYLASYALVSDAIGRRQTDWS